MSSIAVSFQGISKSFGSVKANQNVSFDVATGSIHGVIGENGAGKSTLMSILYGYYQADGGEILIHGKPIQLKNSQQAIAASIGMVHQHFMLVDDMTVLDNILLGNEGGFALATPRQKALATVRELIERYQLGIDPLAKISDLSVGVQQRVEILKQVYRSAQILILDEPTAVLTVQETAALFDILRQFKAQGKTILLITHKLQEIMEITDHVTVMRAGQVVGSVATAQTDRAQLAQMMVGRPLVTELPRQAWQPGACMLEVRDVCLRSHAGVSLLDHIQFSLHAGEILAIAGVSGNGQSELMHILAGMLLPTSGSVLLNGESLISSTEHEIEGLPAKIRQRGLAHVPEDRLRDAVVKNFPLWINAVLGYHEEYANRFGVLDQTKIRHHTQALIEQYDIRPNDANKRIALLSGGNQQKLVMAREMANLPKVLLVGQPTRGVDIGTIETLHKRLLALRDQGVAILLVSVELEEVRALADRIIVMSGGKITGEIRGDAFDATELGCMMGGVERGNAGGEQAPRLASQGVSA